MYTILNNAEMLTREEIKNLYDGKWIYLTNCEFTPGSKLIRGIPRVVADKQYDGVDDGIYNLFDDTEQFGETYGHTLLHFDYMLKNISFLPKGGSNETGNVHV